MGDTGTTAYPHRCRPITHERPTCTSTGTCDSGSIRVLHADDANGGWCAFSGARNISSVRNPDLDKVGTADLLTGCHGHGDHRHRRIKRSRHEEVVVGQIKWAVDKSKRAISRKFEEGSQYEKVAVYALGG